jgi:hypothetical protein
LFTVSTLIQRHEEGAGSVGTGRFDRRTARRVSKARGIYRLVTGTTV